MARRIALIVGVSHYTGLAPLPNSLRDAAMLVSVLQHVAGFDDVQLLQDPDERRLGEAVELLFNDRAPEDLLLFYFSGHGVKDDRGLLFFAVPETRRHANGELVRSSAVSSRHVHDVMNNSRSRRQVVILDCCFSGAFADGTHAKDGGRVDLRESMGGEGRAVLASSSSTQYSFDTQDGGLSLYTQFLVHGIATGEADLNHDGLITADELHEYARTKVQATRPAMSPQILPAKEGYSIVISKARRVDPVLAYAAKVRELADPSGALPVTAVEVLRHQRRQLGLSGDQARLLEENELAPIRKRAVNRATLRRSVFAARRKKRIEVDRPLLNELRIALNLTESDLRSMLEEPITLQRQKVRGWMFWPERMAILSAFMVGFAIVVTLARPTWDAWRADTKTTPQLQPHVVAAPTEPKPPAAEAKPRRERPWWCICYVRNNDVAVTACRESAANCESLRRVIHGGSDEIRARSATTSCESVHAEHPGDVLVASTWRPSQKAGSWVSEGACLLPAR
ncbi:caspase family protein [Nannocystis bainbridge]|uniref:Caspase family protein n=1 Tax=Nannocystis bainbridge TaxID=2995303 RepID=A0ABT5E2S3_9BACT|nr:caspase family protein [Nannocystis bainbridge]MDC0720175.1 caspase family protein [Nannocystis bainbridge]